MSKQKKQKKYYNPAKKHLTVVPVITDYFEPAPGLEYEDVPEELHIRVATRLALDEMEQFAHAPVDSGNIREYVYGEARKHNQKSAYTLVIKRKGGFEHVYLTREQVRTRLAQVVEMGIINFSDIDSSLMMGGKL